MNKIKRPLTVDAGGVDVVNAELGVDAAGVDLADLVEGVEGGAHGADLGAEHLATGGVGAVNRM